jgi:hypothetical protein
MVPSSAPNSLGKVRRYRIRRGNIPLRPKSLFKLSRGVSTEHTGSLGSVPGAEQFAIAVRWAADAVGARYPRADLGGPVF